MFCGSAFKNKGVQAVLDAMIYYMPSPTEVDAIKGLKEDSDEEIVRNADDAEPFAALAFKIATDPFVGKLSFIRVYSGTIKAGSYVYNPLKGEKERVGRIVQMHANSREEIKEIKAGDIAAIIGLKHTNTGESLCDEKNPIILQKMDFPEPVISIAVEPKSKADQEKMGIALSKLAEEDPSFQVKSDEETGQTVISGMGELHLDIIVDRMKREFKVECNSGNPQVAYRETIQNEVQHEEKYSKQSGGRGQFAHILMRLKPQEPGAGYQFTNSVVGGKIPKEFIPSVDKGIQNSMSRGIIAGFPMVDLEIELYDGSYHDVDSSQNSFEMCGSMAFREAAKKASPVLLEPIMAVEITTPEEFFGDVMGNVSSKRGQIRESGDRGMAKVIQAFVPLSEMFGYATELRSMTQGRATYSMEFDHYEKVPSNVAEKIKEERA